MEIDWNALALWGVTIGIPLLVNTATLVTVAFIISAEIRRKRRIRSVVWDISRIGYKVLPDGTKLNRVSITNNGSETALLSNFVMCNAAFEENPDKPFRWQFPPHQPQDITFFSENPDEAWVFLNWISADNRKQTIWSWFPLMPESPLEEEQLKQIKEQTMFRVLSRRLRGLTIPIGPGGQFGVKTGRTELSAKKQKELLGLVTKATSRMHTR